MTQINAQLYFTKAWLDRKLEHYLYDKHRDVNKYLRNNFTSVFLVNGNHLACCSILL